MRELYTALLRDLESLGVDTSKFKLVLRPYSKSYYGRYFSKTKKIFLYIYRDENLMYLFPYKQLLETALHEAVHAIQYSQKNYVRVKGVMHDTEFKTLFAKYSEKIDKSVANKKVRIEVC